MIKAKNQEQYYEIIAAHPNKISIKIIPSTNNSNTDQFQLIVDKCKNSVLFWIIVFSAIMSILTSDNKNTKEEKTATYSYEQKQTIRKVIQTFGYSCTSIDSIIRSEWDGDYSVACNGYQYLYEIEDKGGNWAVKLNE